MKFSRHPFFLLCSALALGACGSNTTTDDAGEAGDASSVAGDGSLAMDVVHAPDVVHTPDVVATMDVVQPVDARTCPTGQLLCGDACVTSASDHGNCGSCGHACGATQMCTTGVCVDTCPSPQVACAGTCATFATDHANCGSCGHACAANQMCAAGHCALDCGATLARCTPTAPDGGAITTLPDGGAATEYCSDTHTDAQNCGACGAPCPHPAGTVAICTASVCSTMCASGFADCDGNAVNGCELPTASDTANCGACGVRCADGQTCAAGRCTTGWDVRPGTQAFVDACAATGSVRVLAGEDDRNSSLQTIPFTFAFMGGTYTDFVVSSNGYLALGDGATNPDNYDNTFPRLRSARPQIAVLADDLEERTAAVGGGICIATIGTAPHRQLVVQVHDAELCCADTINTGGEHINVEMVLNEDGSIDYVYGTLTAYSFADQEPGAGGQDSTGTVGFNLGDHVTLAADRSFHATYTAPPATPDGGTDGGTDAAVPNG